MTRFSLVPHPDFPPLAVSAVDVEVTLGAGEIALLYRVDAARALVVPAPATPKRTDGLWKTTCFELFLKPMGEAGYVELNFAPSGRWAAYAFDGYRAGKRDLAAGSPRVRWADAQLFATAGHPGLVPGSTVPPEQPRLALWDGWTPEQVRGDEEGWIMALSAVIEEEGGQKSYWALAHAPGPPDFHNPDCFIARLPAPGRP